MTPEQFRQIEALFHRGKGLPPEERRALLDAECGDDAEVRAEVEQLLAQADPDETLADLKGKVGQVLRPGADDPSATAAGPAIEGYEILREIHRGGQGVVYQAVQKSTKRKVAIKVLLEGPYASKAARRRFEREIELVAQLKHPNIVSIFHSGQTSDGRQYCVMDYVRGVPLDQYVRNEKLTLEDALKLFTKICEAVNYAHQKGVIHRDLKPSNILVTPPLTKGGPGGDGRGKGASESATKVGDPKVLDFGLAKQLICPDVSLISLTGQVVGTLPYMSPEQAEGNPDKIDIRTDVYALGVILYQMLTGHYPYPVAGQMADVLKHIAETEPTPPTRSWKSGSGVTQRATKRIRPGQCPIDDEVQTIVMRTLAKERERRYQSAGELAKDVCHYLADEPIDAKRDSAFYVIRKQLRRYKLPVAVAAAFVLLLSGATVALSIMYQNQNRAREKAAKERQGTLKMQRRYELQRMIPKLMTNQLREDYKNKNVRTGRELMYDKTWKLVLRGLDEENHDTLIIMNELASLYAMVGRDKEAESLFVKTLEARRRLLDDKHPDTLISMNNLATLYHKLGRYEEAEPLFVKTLEVRRRVLGEEHAATLASMNSLAALYYDQGRYDQAEPLLKHSVTIMHRVSGTRHPLTRITMNDQPEHYENQRRFDQRVSRMIEGINNVYHWHRSLGMQDLAVRLLLEDMAEFYEQQCRLDDALPIRSKLLVDFLVSRTERYDVSPSDLNEIAWTLLTTNVKCLRDQAAAFPIAQKAVEKSGGKDPVILYTLALAYYLNGATAKAIETEENALALLPPMGTAVTDGGSVAKDGDFVTKQNAVSRLRNFLEKNLARFRGAAASQSTETKPATTQPTSRPTSQPTSQPM